MENEPSCEANPRYRCARRTGKLVLVNNMVRKEAPGVGTEQFLACTNGMLNTVQADNFEVSDEDKQACMRSFGNIIRSFILWPQQ